MPRNFRCDATTTKLSRNQPTSTTMKRRPVPSQILRLDHGNASKIAHRVGRTESTIRRWQREGIPKSARDDCLKALARHDRAVRGAASRKKALPPAARKPPSKPVSRPAKLPPRISKPKIESAFEFFDKIAKVPLRVKKPDGSSTIPQRQRVVIPSGIIIPLTEKEKGERAAQLDIIRQMRDYLEVRRLIDVIRVRQIPGLENVHGVYGPHRSLLQDMIRNEDERWMKFSKFCDELGFRPREIRNSWFSPKALSAKQQAMSMRLQKAA